MADFALTSPRFPVGTTVGVYTRRTVIRDDSGPIGAAITTAVTDADLTTTFTGLAYDTDYWAAASIDGTWRKVQFTTDPDPAIPFAHGLTITPPAAEAPITMTGTLEGTGGGGRYVSGMAVLTSLGTNGARGDSIASDAANGNDSTQYTGYYVDASALGTTAFDDKGSLMGVDAVVAIDPYSGGGDVYGEAGALYGVVYTRRKGALTSVLEGLNEIEAGKPARACGVRVVMDEDNAPADYTAAIFGGASTWPITGARGLEVYSAGAQKLGTGLQFLGAGGFERLIDYWDGTRSPFKVLGLGTVVVHPATIANVFGTLQGADTTYRLAINSDGSIFRGSGSVAAALGFLYGAGSPEGVVTGAVGSIYQRTDGGAGTSLYVKESGAGDTGWVAK